MTRRRLDSNSGGGSDVSPNILITVLILAIAVILSASLYLLLRFFRRYRNSSTTTTTTINLPHSRRVSPNNPLLDALPLFSFDSLKSTGDCAVCLSKFEEKDLLRLLPMCCHVFHADCIDTWLNSNQSCPLCRSAVFESESEVLAKVGSENPAWDSRSFRVEIGNVSERNSGEIPVGRTYSLSGSLEYVVDDDVVSEVQSGSFRRTSFKMEEQEAAEVGSGGWLKDFLTHSVSSSFRGSGRWFFTGSSRRETRVDNSHLDFQSSPLGDEIGELFRWLSGV